MRGLKESETLPAEKAAGITTTAVVDWTSAMAHTFGSPTVPGPHAASGDRRNAKYEGCAATGRAKDPAAHAPRSCQLPVLALVCAVLFGLAAWAASERIGTRLDWSGASDVLTHGWRGASDALGMGWEAAWRAARGEWGRDGRGVDGGRARLDLGTGQDMYLAMNV